MGVIVRRYIDILIILFPTPLVLARRIPPLFIFKMNFHSFVYNIQPPDLHGNASSQFCKRKPPALGVNSCYYATDIY